jgi:flavin-dependent dehydrogenase
VHDVIVVGSRCAGASVARLLAQRGHDVLLADRAHFPSDIVSTHSIAGGGVTQLRRWGLMESVLETNVPFVPGFTLTIGPHELRNPMGEDPQRGSVSPRRTVLDKLLVDAAVEAGAELREGVTIKDLVSEGGRVVGVTGHDEDGKPVDERASVVIGADGTYSTVAKLTGAGVYDERPGCGSGYYAYFSDFPTEAVELAFSQGHFTAAFPTNDGQVCIAAGRADERFSEFKGNTDTVHADVVATTSPRLGELIRQAQRQSRFFAFRTVPGFLRVSYGSGWALVGDAGYYKDPMTGHGITDAFRDAELLAEAIHAALDGEDWDKALGSYQRRRDEMSRDVFETTQQIASLEWDEDSLLEIFMRFGAAVMAEEQAIGAFS